VVRGMAPHLALRNTTRARSSRVQALAQRQALCVGECVCAYLHNVCVCVCVCVCLCVCARAHTERERERDREIATWQGGKRSGRARNTCVATAGMATSCGANSRAAA
jgi:hypothetical protein